MKTHVRSKSLGSEGGKGPIWILSDFLLKYFFKASGQSKLAAADVTVNRF